MYLDDTMLGAYIFTIITSSQIYPLIFITQCCISSVLTVFEKVYFVLYKYCYLEISIFMEYFFNLFIFSLCVSLDPNEFLWAACVCVCVGSMVYIYLILCLFSHLSFDQRIWVITDMWFTLSSCSLSCSYFYRSFSPFSSVVTVFSVMFRFLFL